MVYASWSPIFWVSSGKIQRVKTQRAQTSENFVEEKMFAEDISEDFSDLTSTGFYSISGYLRNLRGRLLSSEKFSEVFTLWVFTLKPFPAVLRSSARAVTINKAGRGSRCN